MSRIYRISFLFLALTTGLMLAFAVFPVAAGPHNATLYAAPTPNGKVVAPCVTSVSNFGTQKAQIIQILSHHLRNPAKLTTNP